MTQIVIDNGVSERDFTVLDLTRFTALRSLEIGYSCFSYVTEVKLVGLSALESVVIGRNSFTKKKESWGNDPSRRFLLKDCPKLKTLRIGEFSFSDYASCEIQNNSMMEAIELTSYNFYSAPSLELKGVIVRCGLMNRPNAIPIAFDSWERLLRRFSPCA